MHDFFLNTIVGVFCSPSRMSHSMEESYPSGEMQAVYSTAPADWAIERYYVSFSESFPFIDIVLKFMLHWSDPCHLVPILLNH